MTDQKVIQSAFPVLELGGQGLECTDPGMLLRDYLAANAPTEIPDWYQPNLATPTAVFPMPDWQQFKDPKKREEVRSWVLDGTWDLEDDLAWFQKDMKQHRESRNKAESEYRVLRYFAWRWYYADMMMASREWDSTLEQEGA